MASPLKSISGSIKPSSFYSSSSSDQQLPVPSSLAEETDDPKRFDFGFAFNNPDFADRIVKLHIVPDGDTFCYSSSSSCASSRHSSPRRPSSTPSSLSGAGAREGGVAAAFGGAAATVLSNYNQSTASGQPAGPAAGSAANAAPDNAQRPSPDPIFHSPPSSIAPPSYEYGLPHLVDLNLGGGEEERRGKSGFVDSSTPDQANPSQNEDSTAGTSALSGAHPSVQPPFSPSFGSGRASPANPRNNSSTPSTSPQPSSAAAATAADLAYAPQLSPAGKAGPVAGVARTAPFHPSSAPAPFHAAAAAVPGGAEGRVNSGGGGGGHSSVGASEGRGEFYGRVVALHLSSVVLAAKSSFFRTLFTCGLKETNNNSPVVLTLAPEEEMPVMELLRFIYTGRMQDDLFCDPEPIIKMYLVGDKFGVSSCMKICAERLSSLPMSLSTACMYLSLPETMHSHKGVEKLLAASEEYLVNHFRDLERVFRTEEFLELSLVGVQTLLSSDELSVRDETVAFQAMAEWVRHHYEDMEDRRRGAARLSEFVRFPLMTGDDLEEIVLKAPEMDSPECHKLVKEAVWFRSYSLVKRLRLMNDTAATHRRFWQRNWNRNSVGFVYFDIHLERFKSLAVAQTVESATFGIGGKRFYLSARHGRRDDGTETLDIHLHLENSQSVAPEIQVSFIFYAKRWPEGQFDYLRDRVTKGFGRNASNWGYSNILGRPWLEVVQDGSKYFNHGVMSVFAEVQILDLQGQDAHQRAPTSTSTS